MAYYSKDGYTIVKKHDVILFFYWSRFVFQLLITCIIAGAVLYNYKDMGDDVTQFVMFPLVFIMLNYVFISLICRIIEYNNYLFIIFKDQIFILNSSLVLRDNIEIIDAFKIIKLDVFSRGFFSNLLSYGEIVIELQTREERLFHFMPQPYKLLDKLKIQRERVLENRKKKYIVGDDYPST